MTPSQLDLFTQAQARTEAAQAELARRVAEARLANREWAKRREAAKRGWQRRRVEGC